MGWGGGGAGWHARASVVHPCTQRIGRWEILRITPVVDSEN